MSKSIASIALAIAEKREEERLEAVKEEFLDIMRKYFEKRIISCEPWEALDGDKYYRYGSAFNGINVEDLIKVCDELGFLLMIDSYAGTCLSIPKLVKGQKRTQAQKMLYWSNMEIKRNIKSRKDAARKICKEALEKIKNGDFESSRLEYNYDIKVKVSYSEDNKEFRDEVASFFEKKNFTLLGIDAESNTWNFSIKAS